MLGQKLPKMTNTFNSCFAVYYKIGNQGQEAMSRIETY